MVRKHRSKTYHVTKEQKEKYNKELKNEARRLMHGFRRFGDDSYTICGRKWRGVDVDVKVGSYDKITCLNCLKREIHLSKKTIERAEARIKKVVAGRDNARQVK